jgi:transcriptional regulator with GAF, ATPase, and Fis domain
VPVRSRELPSHSIGNSSAVSTSPPPIASRQLRRQDGFFGSSRTLTGAERLHIISTLQETNWVVGGENGAASRLGLPRTTLISKMRRLRISKDGITHGDPVEGYDREFLESHSPVLGSASLRRRWW